MRSFDGLLETVRELLGPDGCPWDREQTHRSLGRFVIEEAYEVLEAIERGDGKALCEELGDLLLMVVFHAEIAGADGAFTIEDVIQTLDEKLIRRHPHVFGRSEAATAEEVEARWNEIRRSEGSDRGVIEQVPKSLPALRRAQIIGERLSQVGFDWDGAGGPRAKLDEELAELDEAIEEGDNEVIENELGDVLHATVSLGRHLDVDAEGALRRALERFGRRWTALERELGRRGAQDDQYGLDELEELWQKVKRDL